MIQEFFSSFPRSRKIISDNIFYFSNCILSIYNLITICLIIEDTNETKWKRVCSCWINFVRFVPGIKIISKSFITFLLSILFQSDVWFEQSQVFLPCGPRIHLCKALCCMINKEYKKIFLLSIWYHKYFVKERIL